MCRFPNSNSDLERFLTVHRTCDTKARTTDLWSQLGSRWVSAEVFSMMIIVLEKKKKILSK